MSEQKTILQEGIADILVHVPASPESWFSVHNLLVIIGLLLLIVIVWRFFFSPRSRSLRMLSNRVAAAVSREDYTGAVFSIASVVCARVSTNRLDRKTELPASLLDQMERWESFISKINSSRYSALENNIKEVQDLSKEAAFWIRKWR